MKTSSQHDHWGDSGGGRRVKRCLHASEYGRLTPPGTRENRKATSESAIRHLNGPDRLQTVLWTMKPRFGRYGTMGREKSEEGKERLLTRRKPQHLVPRPEAELGLGAPPRGTGSPVFGDEVTADKSNGMSVEAFEAFLSAHRSGPSRSVQTDNEPDTCCENSFSRHMNGISSSRLISARVSMLFIYCRSKRRQKTPQTSSNWRSSAGKVWKSIWRRWWKEDFGNPLTAKDPPRDHDMHLC